LPKASSDKGVGASSKGLLPRSDIDRQPAPSKPAEVVAQKTAPQVRQKGSATAEPAAGPAKTAPRPRSEPSKETPAAASSAGKKELQKKELQKKKPAVEKKQAAEKKPASKKKGMPPPYNPEGKVDPFKPLFKEKPDLPEKRSRPKRIPRTPLERVALSQLKLTAIIMAPSGNRALVQEASGKGYVIKNGTYIGLNAGKVVEIQKDRVIIEEEVEDIVGKLIKRKQELKLPKPAEER
jgi:type IV pilus assembly protein PilP